MPETPDTPPVDVSEIAEVFNEHSLRREIVNTWGPAGAHIDVFDTLLDALSAERAAHEVTRRERDRAVRESQALARWKVRMIEQYGDEPDRSVLRAYVTAAETARDQAVAEVGRMREVVEAAREVVTPCQLAPDSPLPDGRSWCVTHQDWDYFGGPHCAMAELAAALVAPKEHQ